MIIKQLTLECLECGWSETVDDTDEKYEELLDLDTCPNCLRIIAEKI